MLIFESAYFITVRNLINEISKFEACFILLTCAAMINSNLNKTETGETGGFEHYEVTKYNQNARYTIVKMFLNVLEKAHFSLWFWECVSIQNRDVSYNVQYGHCKFSSITHDNINEHHESTKLRNLSDEINDIFIPEPTFISHRLEYEARINKGQNPLENIFR